jgi:hypothetical protein
MSGRLPTDRGHLRFEPGAVARRYQPRRATWQQWEPVLPMNATFSLLILAVFAAAPTEPQPPEPTTLYRCGFEPESDLDYDDWPDGWTRRRGSGFPHYLPARIVAEDAVEGKACLRVDLDGGAVAASTPVVPADGRFSYLCEGWIRTANLKHDQAYLSLELLDAEQRVVERWHSQRLRGTSPWTQVRIGPVSNRSRQVRYAQITVHLEPAVGVDLQGTAWFDDLRLAQLPRLALSCDAPYNLYPTGQPVRVTCDVSGAGLVGRSVELQLLDVEGNHLTAIRRTLEAVPEPQRPVAAFDASDDLIHGQAEPPHPAIAPVVWQLPVSRPGLYRVRVTLPGTGWHGENQQLLVAVVEPSSRSIHGEFGWSLFTPHTTWNDPALAELLFEAGINWVKLPLWNDEAQPHDAQQLGELAERLSSHGIAVVGVLDSPPAAVRHQLELPPMPLAGNVFGQQPDDWYPSLEDVLARFALLVRAWQLGRDGDTSFVGYPELAQRMTDTKTRLDRIGQDVNLGFGWDWTVTDPAAEQPAWRFLAMWAQPHLTAAELSSYLAYRPGPPVARWVHLQPLDARRYPLPERTLDLVHRMVAAKVHGAATVFVSRPIDSWQGLVTPDGSVGELFLPWRTTARALAGARYLGQLRLPGGSSNHVFARGGEVVMVVWSDAPGAEHLFLGDGARLTDVWGRELPLPERAPWHELTVDRMPRFVTGVSQPITQWRLATHFEKKQVPSVFGTPHANGLTVTNSFDRSVSGRIRLDGGPSWRIVPREMEINLAAGETRTLPLEVILAADANTGPHLVRVDFEVTADRPYRFSAYDEVEVGLGDLLIEISSYTTEDGDLEVVQRLVNRGNELVSFRCSLYAPNQRRLRWQVVDLGHGQDLHVYRIRGGADLAGQTLWIRADEIGGPRVLSYRFTAGQD